MSSSTANLASPDNQLDEPFAPQEESLCDRWLHLRSGRLRDRDGLAHPGLKLFASFVAEGMSPQLAFHRSGLHRVRPGTPLMSPSSPPDDEQKPPEAGSKDELLALSAKVDQAISMAMNRGEPNAVIAALAAKLKLHQLLAPKRRGDGQYILRPWREMTTQELGYLLDKENDATAPGGSVR